MNQNQNFTEWTQITSKTVDWSEITNTARSKGLKKSWILQEYLSPPSTVPKVGTRRIPVIAVEKYGTGEKEETAFVDRHVINESAGVPWTYRPVHLSEERGVCVCGGGGGRMCNYILHSQSAVKSIVARASCFLQEQNRNTLEIKLLSITDKLFCGYYSILKGILFCYFNC